MLNVGMMSVMYPEEFRHRWLVTFHQRCINSLMIEVYKYLNGHSPDIINDIFKLRENTYNLRNFHIFQLANSSNKYLLISVRERTSLILFKNLIKTWKWEDCPYRSCKIFIQNVGYVWLRRINNWSWFLS